MSQLSVLVVDDNRDILEYMSDLLSAEGYRVTTMDDPAAVLARIRDEIFHIVILDMMMPKIHGLELLTQIREVDDDIAVIILTGHPTYEQAQQAIALDVSAFIEKPSSAQEFRDHISRIVRRKGIVLRSDGEVLAQMGQRIRNLRRDRQLTLRQLSRRTSLSVSLLSQIERAESSASVSSLVKVSAALDVRIAELFENDEPEMSRPRRPATEDAPLNAPRSS